MAPHLMGLGLEAWVHRYSFSTFSTFSTKGGSWKTHKATKQTPFRKADEFCRTPPKALPLHSGSFKHRSRPRLRVELGLRVLEALATTRRSSINLSSGSWLKPPREDPQWILEQRVAVLRPAGEIRRFLVHFSKTQRSLKDLPFEVRGWSRAA